MTAAEWMRIYQQSSLQVKRGEEDFIQTSLLLERSDSHKKQNARNLGPRSTITRRTIPGRMKNENNTGKDKDFTEGSEVALVAITSTKGNELSNPSNSTRVIIERGIDESRDVIMKKDNGNEKQSDAVGVKAKSTPVAALNFGHVMTAAIIEEFYTAPPPAPVALKPTSTLSPFSSGGGMNGTVRSPSPEHGARWLPQYDYAGDTGDEGDDGFECCSDDSALNEMDDESNRYPQEVEEERTVDVDMSHSRDTNKNENENYFESIGVNHSQNRRIETVEDKVSVLEESEWGLPCTDSFIGSDLQSANTSSKPDRAVHPPVSTVDMF